MFSNNFDLKARVHINQKVHSLNSNQKELLKIAFIENKK